MSRILDALKQLEKRQPESSAQPSAAAPESSTAMPANATECGPVVPEAVAPAASQPIREISEPASLDSPAPSGLDVAAAALDTADNLVDQLRAEMARDEKFAAILALREAYERDRAVYGTGSAAPPVAPSYDSVQHAVDATAEQSEVVAASEENGMAAMREVVASPTEPPAEQILEESEISIFPFSLAAPAGARDAGGAEGRYASTEQTRAPLAIDTDTLKGYRTLAQRLVAEHAGDDFSVIALACATPSAHRHFSATNLAVALGECGDGEVLLLSAEGRGAGTTRVGSKPGWAEAIVGVADWGHVIQNTPAPQVSIAVSGDAAFEVADGTRAWRGLEHRFRFVLIDAGVAGSEAADWLAAHSDSAYLAVALRETRRQTALDAASALEAAGARLQGLVAIDPAR